MSDRVSTVLRPEHPLPRSLAQLVSEFELDYEGSIDGIEVSGVTVSTGDVHPGDLFVGLPGAKSHGASFAAQAHERGAVAMLTDRAGLELAEGSGLPVVIVEHPRSALGDISAWVYQTADHLPLLLGVTGTNGKTSTAYLVEAILKQLGLVVGLSSTAERHIADLVVVSRLTTPEASELHSLLARMRESEVRAVVVEVSAQALSRHRIDGLVFDVVAFLNLSHDHLDEYTDMEKYFSAKLSFFEPDRGKRGVVSLDSSWGQRIVEDSHIPVTTISATPGISAEWSVEILEYSSEYTSFRLTGPEGRSLESRVPLIGWHMAANAGLAIVMLVEAGFELEAIGHSIRDGIEVYLPGRLERVSGDLGPTVYLDYGHTPEAFQSTLEAIRAVTAGRIIMVFGADGDRDPTKREEMGRIASEGADVLIVTDYNPRYENPQQIRESLLTGAKSAAHPAQLHEIVPEAKAIRHAVALAHEGDSILWAGPGDEDYRDANGTKSAFSARSETLAALREAGW